MSKSDLFVDFEDENLHEKLDLKEEMEELIVLYDYEPTCDDELRLVKGEKLKLISKDDKISGDEGWWVGQSGNQYGLFPCTFVISQVC